MLTGELVKATITNLDTNDSVECLFNPSEYTFSKSNTWAVPKKKGANTPPLEFNGGNPTELKLSLFFDTYETGEDVRRTYTNAIWELALVNRQRQDPRTHKSTPPQCEFRWGTLWSFKAVVSAFISSHRFSTAVRMGTRSSTSTPVDKQDSSTFPIGAKT